MSKKNVIPKKAALAVAAAAALFMANSWSALFALRGAGRSEVWPDISAPASPVGGGGRDAAVIVAIEEAPKLPRLSGANANAWAWFDYFNKTRGVPGVNIIMLLEAEGSAQSIKEAAARAAGLAGPDGTLWLIFIGRGGRDATAMDTLLYWEGQRTGTGVYAAGITQKELLTSLAASKAGAVAAIFDACFPGKDAGGLEPASGAKAANYKKTITLPDARFTVLASGMGEECAGRLPGAERPALSYLALGGLRGWADTNGDKEITASELQHFILQAFPSAVQGREIFQAIAGGTRTVLGLSAGEKGPDMSNMVKTASPVVNSGLTFKAGVQPAVPQGMDARAWTRDTDWNKLSRMLFYAAGEGEKKILASAFVRAHGTIADENPYVVYLLPFLNMAMIPSGGFFMGSPGNEGGPDESPRREVYLDAFCIDKHEVTEAAYKEFSAATGRQMPEQPTWSASTYPVVNIDWDSAAAYCEAAGKRLPTEAEWEKAARGGAITRYSFGDDEKGLDDYAWYHANSGGQSHPVGLKKPNQYGVYDMAGNVWEWVADRYGANYYKTAPAENPKGPGSGQQRVLRGGSWNFFDVSPRPGDRASDFPSSRSQRGGFRCAF